MSTVALILDEDDCVILTHLVKELFNERISLVCTVSQKDFFSHLGPHQRIPDLIILDYHVPPDTAIELIALIKLQVNIEQVPLIVWSAKASPEQQLDCLAKGAREYLSKETGLDALSKQLYQLFTRYLPDLS